MKRNKNRIKELKALIDEGNKYSFKNNKKETYYGIYSSASSDFLAWFSKVENYIFNHYDENSGPSIMIKSVNKRYFDGFEEGDFERELKKIQGAIKSCINTEPNKKTKENKIVSLIKNPFFWTLLSIFVGGAYKFGYDNGRTKFEKEKIEIHEENKNYKENIKLLQDEIKLMKDSLDFLIKY